MTTIYGIKNCDTMKKAFKWLDQHDIDYQFHDFKKAGLEEKQLRAWVKQVGWESLVNRRGTTWRKLDEAVKANIDEAGAVRVMLDNPSIVKRPVLELDGTLYVGFDALEYARIFG